MSEPAAPALEDLVDPAVVRECLELLRRADQHLFVGQTVAQDDAAAAIENARAAEELSGFGEYNSGRQYANIEDPAHYASPGGEGHSHDAKGLMLEAAAKLEALAAANVLRTNANGSGFAGMASAVRQVFNGLRDAYKLYDVEPLANWRGQDAADAANFAAAGLAWRDRGQMVIAVGGLVFSLLVVVGTIIVIVMSLVR